MSVIICEHQRKTIRCEGGATISVLRASYGRHDGHTCPHPSIRTTNCNAATSLPIVQGDCDDQASCNLFASNSIFGDPCVGTFKYLEVEYECIGGKSSVRIVRKVVVVILKLVLVVQLISYEESKKKRYTEAEYFKRSSLLLRVRDL